MFGQLLDMLDHSVDFDQKDEFIAGCKKLSAARNRLAHELDKGVLSLPDIETIAKACVELGSEITDASTARMNTSPRSSSKRSKTTGGTPSSKSECGTRHPTRPSS